MKDVSIKEVIINELNKLPVCTPNSNQTQWTVRCPYCGDSTNKSHGHLSIKIDINSEDSMPFRCFKCNETGVLNSQVLEDLKIDNLSVSKSLSKFNSTASKGGVGRNGNKRYTIPMYNKTVPNILKLNYINERIGSRLLNADCSKYSIILSFKEFLQHNNIKLDIKQNTLDEIDEKYVGFISVNKNKITFRDTTGKGFFGRYYKVTLDPYHSSISNFYSINSAFNVMYTDEMNIHICEGTFDILSVVINLSESHTSGNNLYFASCGFNFGTIIKYAVSIGAFSKLVVHVYADNDKNDEEVKKSLRISPALSDCIRKIIIHRNGFSGEKDFGVTPDRIEDVFYKA